MEKEERLRRVVKKIDASVRPLSTNVKEKGGKPLAGKKGLKGKV